ncbi:MAG: hypothetical protein NTV14_06050 [Coprothermobacterota bacterium]|nr:hypothetical protein [Coprothermobacterota bacterium]
MLFRKQQQKEKEKEKEKTLDETIKWLLEGPPWVQYRARRDLLGEREEESAVIQARRGMSSDPVLLSLIRELTDWPGMVLNSHKSAGHSLHKLVFLADLGFQASDPGMAAVIDRVLAHRADEGPFQVLMNIPRAFGGSGEDQWAWALCDAPLLIYALSLFGFSDDPRVKAALGYLAGLVRENGWPCAVSPQLGSFRGPGRRDDPCPYATLVMLKVLSLDPQGRQSSAARSGAESLLGLWAQRQTRHPYLFYMGTDFCKLKTPLVWYDLLHLVEVLSRFPFLTQDPRLAEMAEILRGKADGQGRFTGESAWMAWKGWEFSQKKSPSRWLTLLTCRALQRISSAPPEVP